MHIWYIFPFIITRNPGDSVPWLKSTSTWCFKMLVTPQMCVWTSEWSTKSKREGIKIQTGRNRGLIHSPGKPRASLKASTIGKLERASRSAIAPLTPSRHENNQPIRCICLNINQSDTVISRLEVFREVERDEVSQVQRVGRGPPASVEIKLLTRLVQVQDLTQREMCIKPPVLSTRGK